MKLVLFVGFFEKYSYITENSSVGRAVDCRVLVEIDWSLVQFRVFGFFFLIFAFLYVGAQNRHQHNNDDNQKQDEKNPPQVAESSVVNM